MQFINNIQSFENAGTVATLGFFDGVHLGHRFLIDQVKSNAKKLGLQSIVITFDQHPRKVLYQDFQPKLLNTFDEKIELLQKTNIDFCCVLPFTAALSKLSSFEFLQLLHDKLNVKNLIIGYDHRFGHNREEDFEQYKKYGEILGIDIEQSVPLIENNVAISSSVIRRMLDQGKIEEANYFLGYHYFLSGKVIHGKKIGRSIHFPTANLAVDEQKQLPKSGIYAVRVQLNEHLCNGMLNIGNRPTVETNTQKTTVEVNIFDFDLDIYNETIKILFVKRIRDEQKFSTVQLLAEQLKKDEEIIKQLLTVDK